jgi:predicted O-methyltransferase YrrM
MQGNAPLAVLTGVPGWESDDEQALLFQLAQAVPESGQIVEIGAEYGMSASLFIAGAKPTVRITSVDLFPGDMLAKYRNNLREAGYEGRSTQIQGDSSTAGKLWDGGPIDLLFIDGDHNYEGCKADIDAWVKHVKVHGFVIFHDCASNTNRLPHHMHFFVTRAVSEWFWGTRGKWRQTNQVNSIMVFERVK